MLKVDGGNVVWAVPYPFCHLSHKGSCSCRCLMGHLNHVERSRFWFRVGGCLVFNPGSLFQLPPSTWVPFSSWRDRDFACFSIPETAGPDLSCACVRGAGVPCMGRSVRARPQGLSRAVIPSTGHVLSAVGAAVKPGRGTARVPPSRHPISLVPGVSRRSGLTPWGGFTVQPDSSCPSIVWLPVTQAEMGENLTSLLLWVFLSPTPQWF